MRRLYKLLLPVAAPLLLAVTALRAAPAVPVATDLQQTGGQAQAQQLPVLLFFASTICSYCALLEEDFLQPMQLSGDYDDRVLVRKVVIDQGSRIRDFDGTTVMAGKVADRYRVFVTPTLLFVDGQGRELAERMVGINTPELFGGYLDECIDTAYTLMRDAQATPGSRGCLLQHAADDPAVFRTAAP